MTISTEITPVIAYSGNGSTTVFTIPFVFYTYEDIVVILTDSNGTDTTKTYSTHYTISGGGSSEPDTGAVTMLTAPASGETLTIYRAIERSQDVDYILYNTFPAALHEKALDKLTLITQDLAEEVGRAAKVGVTSGLSGLVFPDPEASKLIAWNALATGLENVDTSDAVLNINSLTAETTIDGDADYIPIYDASEGANNKVLPKNLPVGINNLTEDTTPDSASDYVITYDASAGVNKKVLIQNIPQSGGNAPTNASYLTLATNGTLTNERVLTASTGISLTDNGAGNTLDIAVNVNGPAEETSPVLTDFVLGYDVSGTATKKFKITNIPISPVTNVTTDSSPDTAADYVLTYDDSAGANKKVLIDTLLAGNALVKLSTTTVSSAVANLNFTDLSSVYKFYILQYWGLTSSTNTTILLRTSTDNGSSFTSSAASYQGATVNTGATSSATSITIGVIRSTANTGSSGQIIIYNPMDSTYRTSITSINHSSAAGYGDCRSSDRTAAEANNAVQLLLSSGNYTAGTIIVYGVK
jgi:hypothetical protein